MRKVCDSLGYSINHFNRLVPIPVYKTEKIAKGNRQKDRCFPFWIQERAKFLMLPWSYRVCLTVFLKSHFFLLHFVFYSRKIIKVSSLSLSYAMLAFPRKNHDWIMFPGNINQTDVRDVLMAWSKWKINEETRRPGVVKT